MESLLEQTDRARQKGRRLRKIRNLVVLVLFSGILIFGLIWYYYPYSKGIMKGKLEYVVYKGVIFKTYEGKLMLSDLENQANETDNPSKVFVFSIAKKQVAETLMRSGGKTMELHYTEYFKPIPWRGTSKYVVDRIVGIADDKEIHEEDIIAEKH